MTEPMYPITDDRWLEVRRAEHEADQAAAAAAREPDAVIMNARVLVRDYLEYYRECEAGIYVDVIDDLLDLIKNSADVVDDMLAVIENAGLTYP